ncbi:MAG: hypothetical protein CMH54_01740 [Myxococcales bacterium]|nr:hypothetical protein [Myxococcales bacterium]
MHIRRKILKATIVVMALLFASNAAAVINPKLLKQAQNNAPEQLILQVLKVTVDKKGRDWKVLATARVQEVKASRSGLKVGAEITIRYTSRRPPERPGWTGPKPTPVLSKGLIGAYLNGPGRDGAYRPAARSRSFTAPRRLRNNPPPGKQRKRAK